ncbi:hypothetical protein V7S43_002502 [Phytophthora oleae]|uniref:SUN domain-containing protein n=1 Tax=Phytophthora oleae TaxID=2107226 RepID=A0ABD3FYG7_9STRA
MEGNAYSRRLRSRRRSDSTSSEKEGELEHVSRSGGRRYESYTPEPVQRTLNLRSGDLEEEDEDEDDSDFEELDDFSGTVYRSTTYRPPQVDEEDILEPEDAHEDEEEEQETPEHEIRRSDLKRRAAGAAACFSISQERSNVWQKVKDSKVVKQLQKYLRRMWRFVLRNSFMAVNVLWLLAPLCCFVIAITVPHYLTNAIQYVDILSAKVFGARGSADGTFDNGSMRSVVQEIVDIKMVGMNKEIGLLRQTVVSQEREIEALKLLHDTLRHAHDESQQKFSLAEPTSTITVHIEKVVAKHTEELWEKFVDSTSRLQQDVRAATKQQSVISSALKEQEEKMDSVQDIVEKTSSVPTPDVARETARLEEITKEFTKWRNSFELELQSEMQRKVQDIENRVSRALQQEKEALTSSADALRGLDATDPGILRVIEVAVQAVEIKKTGRVDHAALANGASVIHSERDLLYQDSSSPVQLLTQLVGLSNPDDDGRFTSPSYRRAPAPFLGQLLSSGENPWWLSRHNGRPETALSETMEMGSCWGIAGSSGRLSVKFAQQIIADAITIDHIPAQIASDFSSAPNEFRVLGISGHPLRETVEFTTFGNFSYASNGASSQTFKLSSPLSQRSPIDGITLEVLSNHGNPEYTCLYRFRVHGQPA